MRKLSVLTHIDYLAETGLSKRTDLRESAREFAKEVRAMEALTESYDYLEEGVGSAILNKVRGKLIANIDKDMSKFSKIKSLAESKGDKRTAEKFANKIKSLSAIRSRLEKVDKLSPSIVVLALLSYLKTLVAVIGIFLAIFGIAAASVAGFAKFSTVIGGYFTGLKAAYAVGGTSGVTTLGKTIAGTTGMIAKGTVTAAQTAKAAAATQAAATAQAATAAKSGGIIGKGMSMFYGAKASAAGSVKTAAVGTAKYGLAHLATMALVGIVAAVVISVALVLLSKLLTKVYLGKLSKAEVKDKATRIANSSLAKAASKLKSAKA